MVFTLPTAETQYISTEVQKTEMKKTGRKIYKAISLVLLIAVMVTIFVLSHQNSDESSVTSGLATKLLSLIFENNIPEAVVRCFGHFTEFCVLGFLTFNCIYAFKQQKKPLLSITFSWLYAWIDEIHQIFIPGRAFQISDLLIDLSGIILGVAVVWAITKKLTNN